MVDNRKKELGDFLRARRARVDRSAFGLPPTGRARTNGLRREEVAAFAGVSVTWLTWLEQGRDINASRQVLEAIARVLSLDAAETTFLLTLGGYTSEGLARTPGPEVMPEHLQRLLDALTFPAFAVASDWTIAGWNRAYQLLYSAIDSIPLGDRNLLWLLFTDPVLRQMMTDWQETSKHFVAEFRAEAGLRLGSGSHAGLLQRLEQASPEFSTIWRNHDVERFTSRQRVFEHPDVGTLEFEHHRFVPSDAPELHVVMYLPMPGSETPERLAALHARTSQ